MLHCTPATAAKVCITSSNSHADPGLVALNPDWLLVSLCVCCPSSHRDDPGSSLCPDSYEVVVNEEVIVPLAPAVRATPLVARKKDEVSPEHHRALNVEC